MVQEFSPASRVGNCLRCNAEAPLGPSHHCTACVQEQALLAEALFSKRPPARLSSSLPPLRPVVVVRRRVIVWWPSVLVAAGLAALLFLRLR